MTRQHKLFGPRSASQLGLSGNHIFVDTNVLASRLHTMLYGSAAETEDEQGMVAFMNQFLA